MFQKLEIVIAPFNQVHQVLLNDKLECWSGDIDFTFVWTKPERVLNSFSAYLNNENIKIEEIIDEVEKYAELLLLASSRVKTFLVSNWTVDLTLNYQGISSSKSETGILDVLSKMNSTLSSVLSTSNNIYIINSQKWVSLVGNTAYSPKLWYLSKTPFHSSVFALAAKDIGSFIKGLTVSSKKIIITDLDNTIWGGVVGDVGYENLILGGHNAVGEAYRDFQLALKAISRKGVVLAITSKNEESVAMNAIENHSEMALRKSDFVAWRINWDDKAKNIFEIAQELNIGLDSIVFLDDNPFERERIKHALPEVFVPELPSDPLLYPNFLLQLDCFNSNSISEEDRKRTELYSIEKQRLDHKKGFNDLEEWLKSIDIRVKCELLNADNLQRVLQLLNKTNQMNLLTARYTEKDLIDRNLDELHFTYAFSVRDNFGDAGLTGVIGLQVVEDTLTFTDFVLSCRVIGRKVEETMLSVAINLARELNLKFVEGKYIQTEKNKPCFDFFQNSKFEILNNSFRWEVEKMYIRPYYIDLEFLD
jgi:FkbH-like protein